MSKTGIIIRTKNRPILLKRALQSIIQQSATDWHIALVNDGGDPHPVDALVSQLDPVHKAKLTLIHHSHSKGMEAASNAGLAALNTKYILIHDDDDSLHRDFLQQATSYLDHPPHPCVKGVVVHAERVIETIQGNSVRFIRSYPYNTWMQSVSMVQMLRGNTFPPIGFCFDRQACMEVGAFREDLPVLGDWDFNVRFLKAYEIGVIPRILAYYHDRDQGEAVAYHSSVSAKADLHLFYDNMLRNEWLREDIAQGICGIGTLSSFGRLFQDFSWEMKDELQKKRKIILFPRK